MIGQKKTQFWLAIFTLVSIFFMVVAVMDDDLWRFLTHSGSAILFGIAYNHAEDFDVRLKSLSHLNDLQFEFYGVEAVFVFIANALFGAGAIGLIFEALT